MKRAFTLPPDWKANVPYTLDSVARYSYQKPNPQEELQVPITRYGSNRKKPVAATGTSKSSFVNFFLCIKVCTDIKSSAKKKIKTKRLHPPPKKKGEKRQCLKKDKDAIN